MREYKYLSSDAVHVSIDYIWLAYSAGVRLIRRSIDSKIR